MANNTNKIETRGRKALLPENRKPPQATIKVNDFILPFVKELKGYLKKGDVNKQTLQRLFNALTTQSETVSELPPLKTPNKNKASDTKNEIQHLKAELRKAHQANIIKPLEPTERLKLVEQYNAEHLKVVHLESKNNSNKSTIKQLNLKIESLEHQAHDCQALKKNGDRCTRLAKTLITRQGFQVNVCVQHST